MSASVAPHAEILAPAFQDELKRTLGIESKIRVMERALLIEELKKGTFDMMVQTEYRSPIGDPGPGWEMCLKTGGSLNFSRYSNPEFDKLIEEGKDTTGLHLIASGEVAVLGLQQHDHDQQGDQNRRKRKLHIGDAHDGGLDAAAVITDDVAADRSGVQMPEERTGHPADPSSTGAPGGPGDRPRHL